MDDDQPAEGLDRLRSQVDDLQAKLAWTNNQHRLWSEERRAMLAKMRDLRFKADRSETAEQAVAKLSAERATLLPNLTEAPRSNARQEMGERWFKQQRQAWEEERSNLVSSLEAAKAWIAELETARTWFEQQRQAWEEERSNLVSSLEAAKAWIAELETARTWFDQQRQTWEAERNSLMRSPRNWARSWFERGRQFWNIHTLSRRR